MAHQALARKYRPRRFAEVSTQEHVSETLRRSVASGRVAHAYLFCGPRGVGKTTLARVLAMALNCPDRSEEGEPCGTCESCTRIWSGHTALDVVEIDAASNRGVDDARDLRERAMYAPSEEERYKIYIVDEAHMLTREAWNALLKILEEPPPRVIFVFATTEPQKIQQSAAPILSRCQRFDFRRIGVADIVARLTEVLEAEGAPAPEDALRTIARKAEGGMRDGLSLLDQVLALTGGEISQDAVRQVLGLVEEDRYLELLDIFRERRHGRVFAFVESLLDEGYDLVEFYHGLADALRTVLRLRLDGEEGGRGLRDDLREAFAERAAAFEPGDLVRMLALVTELENTGSLRRSSQPRMLVEMLLLRMSFLDRTVELEELIRSLGGAPPGETPAGGADGAGGGGGAEPAAVPEPAEAPEEPEGQGKLSLARGGADDRAAGPVEAWRRILGGGADLPPGLAPFLRAAEVSEAGEDRLRVVLPPGPALERLQDAVERRKVEEALAHQLGGRRPVLVVEEMATAPSAAGTRRIDADRVRQDRLRELLAREPLLGRAVEELDLELLD